jgi:general secretion pathway protein D
LNRYSKMLLSLAAAALIAGCAGKQTYREGERALAAGNLEQAYELLQKAAQENPGNYEYRAQLFRVRDALIAKWFAQAERSRAARALDLAEALYRRVLEIAPENSRAAAGLTAIGAERRHLAQVAEAEAAFKAGELDRAEAALRVVLAENPAQPEARTLLRRLEEKRGSEMVSYPALRAAYRKPINLEFRDASLKSVFEVISRSTGVNFIFDKDVRPDLKTTIFVKETSLEDVIKLLLVTNQLERKVLNDNTLLIYPNTPAKNREYQDLVVRSFYLGNADVKQTLNMIKTLLKTRDVFIDEKLNLLIMRDTPDAVRVAEKLISAQDLAEPEVLLEVEVLEVSRNRLLELGINFPDQVSLGQVGEGGVFAAPFIAANRDNLQAFVVNPAILINLHQQDGSTNLLANPRIRVKNREKAKIHIGDRVPVITSTITSTGFAADSVTYLDVGLKLDVEPNVYLDNDVGIKVALEVSNIAREIPTGEGGGLVYQIGTRNAATTLRLKDGETQILAGLISDEERRSADKVPGLAEVPVVGRLFSSHNDTALKTEIVLLITPHVVRNLSRPETVLTEFPFGTDASAGATPLQLRPSAAAVSVPLVGAAGPTPPSAVQAPVPTSPGVAPAPAPPGAAPAPALTPGAGAPAAPPRSAAPPVVSQPLRLNWSAPAQAQIGKVFSANLNASAQELKSASFEIAYDSAALELTGLDEGDFLRQDGVTGSLQANAAQGRAQVSINRPASVSGEGVLAVLSFRVIAEKPGPTQLGVQGLSAHDASGAALSAASPPAHVLNLTR